MTKIGCLGGGFLIGSVLKFMVGGIIRSVFEFMVGGIIMVVLHSRSISKQTHRITFTG